MQSKFDDWPRKAWDFEMLNLAALYYHPSLDVARAQIRLAEAGMRTVNSLPSPGPPLVTETEPP